MVTQQNYAETELEEGVADAKREADRIAAGGCPYDPFEEESAECLAERAARHAAQEAVRLEDERLAEERWAHNKRGLEEWADRAAKRQRV